MERRIDTHCCPACASNCPYAAPGFYARMSRYIATRPFLQAYIAVVVTAEFAAIVWSS